MSVHRWVDGVLRARWDDVARTYTEWDVAGVETLSRPFTADENARADAEAAAEAEADNESAIRAAAAAAIATNRTVIAGADDYLAIGSPTNAQIVAQVRSLTQAARLAADQRIKLIRLGLRDFSGTE